MSKRRAAPMVVGIAAGCILASVVVGATASAVAQRTPADARAVFEATHVPPLLRLRGEPVRLTYDVHCALDGVEDPERGCDASGEVHLRTGDRAAFRVLSLTPTSTGGLPRLAATVPAEIVSSSAGFEYYAELRGDENAGRVVVPGGGADAPQRSLPLRDPTSVDLGTHTFGSTAPGVTVASAPWGEGPASVGLEPGRTLSPIGASAFDVDDAGSVLLLDEAHGRGLRWSPNGAGPSSIGLSIDGHLADVALGGDGSIYVLESVSEHGRMPLVRHFDRSGRALDQVETAEHPSELRTGPNGPVVLQQPSQQWMPVAEGGVPADSRDQRRRATSGRPLRNGAEVVVFRGADEILVALVSDGRERDSWRITSATPLAEIQLAEPIVGQRLLLVVRAYTDTADEFVVLVLDRRGLVAQFSTPTDEWAEAAPLGRFRLAGNRLYRLGSNSSGAFVERYDLGGSR